MSNNGQTRSFGTAEFSTCAVFHSPVWAHFFHLTVSIDYAGRGPISSFHWLSCVTWRTLDLMMCPEPSVPGFQYVGRGAPSEGFTQPRRADLRRVWAHKVSSKRSAGSLGAQREPSVDFRNSGQRFLHRPDFDPFQCLCEYGECFFLRVAAVGHDLCQLQIMGSGPASIFSFQRVGMSGA